MVRKDRGRGSLESKKRGHNGAVGQNLPSCKRMRSTAGVARRVKECVYWEMEVVMYLERSDKKHSRDNRLSLPAPYRSPSLRPSPYSSK